MIQTMLYRPSSGELLSGAEDLIAVWQREPDSIIWADFMEYDPEAEKRLLIDRFRLHPLAIQDAQRSRHPPKVEAFSNNVFVLLKGLQGKLEGFEFGTIQLAMFIGDRFFVTRHSGPSPSIAELWAKAERDRSLIAGGPDSLALGLSRIMVDRYVALLLTLEPRLDDLEVVMAENPDDALLAELTGYKTDLRKFRRVLVYHVQVFSELMRDRPPQIRAEYTHDLRDVYEHQERASSLASLYYEVSADLIDGYISLTSHRLNKIIKVLTIVTAIFVPLSFMAGVYGMNFDNMPELKSRDGYFILLGVMATVATTLVLLFRKKRWL